MDALSEEDKAQLLADGLLLEEKQGQVEDLSCLPRMQLEDINRELIPTTLNRHLEDGEREILFYKLFNLRLGVNFLDIGVSANLDSAFYIKFFPHM